MEQILAPIALHPDPLISQILMASTYPLEVVQAERWAKQNASLKGDALTKALEAQNWDPSVKSLVNFPQVLTMMSEKLDWTRKLGDAFLADQKKVMDTIQSLRAKAQASGNLKTTKEQTVIVEEKIIKIEPASPQVVYVPTYNPTVVYGAWPYPAYPPYYYYPPGYVATSMFAFGAGVAMGAAWGYAWGNCNWNGGDVDVDVNRNTNINNNINRDQAKQKLQESGQGNQKGQGKLQHNRRAPQGGFLSRPGDGAEIQSRQHQRRDQIARAVSWTRRTGKTRPRPRRRQAIAPAPARVIVAARVDWAAAIERQPRIAAPGNQVATAAARVNSVVAAIVAVAAAEVAPIKASIAAAAPPAVPANGAARAGLAAVAQGAAVAVQEVAVVVAADAAGKRSDECRVKIVSTPDPRPSYLISWRNKRCFTI